MKDKRPIIGITMGDPSGIGPEIAVKAMACQQLRSTCWPLLIGDAVIITEAVTLTGLNLTALPIFSIDEARFDPETINVLQVDGCACPNLKHGEISAESGNAAFLAIERAIELAQAGQLDAIVTGPIHKEALHAAGHLFPGHTEIFAQYTQTQDYAMLLIYGDLRVIHVTTHIPLQKVSDAIEPSRIFQVIKLAHEACQKLGIAKPRVGVAGLNPHASDGGLFGSEEKEKIRPAVKQAQATGINAQGPIPPDTLFPKALGGWFDICVAMYHDQGHIPLKVIGFKWDQAKQRWDSVNGVNITLGLPIIRTSVDHGTAFDIAGQGIASPDSMIHAIELAVKLANVKTP
jgi:4-hydroxythreonine-4-phosphate dehydrogenase